MGEAATNVPTDFQERYDGDLVALDAAKDRWAKTSISDRLAILQQIKDALQSVARDWAETAARHKLIPVGSALVGEEWISGPYAVMGACNGLMQTLSGMQGKTFLDGLPTRELVTGQTAVRILPHSIWDHLLFSGITAEVWMKAGVGAGNLARHAASAYDVPVDQREGKVSLVLGAGNIAAIAPLDVFHKVFTENQVVMLKLNPVNAYLGEFLQVALKPLIDRDALRIVGGDGAAGAYLTTHPLVAEIHITGAGATHDAIVWGEGKDGVANKKAGTPINTRRITSELGAVCPTIVVPGPWSAADIAFQAQNIATQKMHNSGFNCVACQALILPKGWDKGAALMEKVTTLIGAATREPYYPWANGRVEAFANKAANVVRIDRGAAPDFVIASNDGSEWIGQNEVFGPALSTLELAADDPETYLRAAIAHANENLHGTLGANVIIHPQTIRKIGKRKFEEIIAELHYGAIAINTWTGLAFLATQCPWGAFPGHRLEDVGSGIGSVHNTYMLEDTERVVVSAPWRPFPRGVLSGQFTLLPKPPWCITNRKAHKIGMLLTGFQYRPSWFKLPRIFLNALLG